MKCIFHTAKSKAVTPACATSSLAKGIAELIFPIRENSYQTLKAFCYGKYLNLKKKSTWPKMLAMCNIISNIVSGSPKETGQSQAETGTVGHSAVETDKAIASDNRKIQEQRSWVALMHESKSLQRPPLGGVSKVPPHLKSPSPWSSSCHCELLILTVLQDNQYQLRVCAVLED